MDFWTYMLECRDGSYYTGHTDEIDVRYVAHQRGLYGGYTARRRPVKMVYCDRFPTRDEAFRAERQIKGWSRAKKAALARSDWPEIQKLARRQRPHLKK